MINQNKRRLKGEPLDLEFLNTEFDTVEEKVEYIFSNIDWDRMREEFRNKPKRVQLDDIKMFEKLKQFMKEKK